MQGMARYYKSAIKKKVRRGIVGEAEAKGKELSMWFDDNALWEAELYQEEDGLFNILPFGELSKYKFYTSDGCLISNLLLYVSPRCHAHDPFGACENFGRCFVRTFWSGAIAAARNGRALC